MKRIYRLIAFSLAMLLLLAPLSACGARRRPLNYLKSAVTRTLSRSGVGEILALITAAVSDGSLSVGFQGSADAPVSAGSAEIYFDENDGRLMADATLTAAGEAYDVKFWLSDSELAMSSTAFLGSTTLGIDLNTLEQDLKNSIFRSNSGTAFANPKVNDRTDDAVKALVEGVLTLYRSGENTKKLLDKRLEGFLKDLTAHANYTRYTENGKVYIYLKVDNSMLSRALRDAWGDAVRDKAFVARLRELAKTRDAMSSALEGVTVDAASAKVEQWLASDAEIEALCARIDNATPFTVELNAAVRRLTADVTSFDVTYQTGDDVRGFSVDLTDKDAAVLTLTLDGTAHKLVYRTEKDGARSYRATFAYDCTGDAVRHVDGTFEVDRRQGAYTLTLAGAATRTVTGKIALEKKAFSVSVERMTVGERALDFACTVGIRAKATMPTMPPYVSLATVTELRFTPVYNRASEAYARLDAALDTSGIELDAEGIVAYLLSLAEINV